MKLLSDRDGRFAGCKKRILKNSQGLYKIQYSHDGIIFFDITYNDTAIVIAGRGNPETQYFYSKKDVDAFIEKYWNKPNEVKGELGVGVIDDFKELE